MSSNSDSNSIINSSTYNNNNNSMEHCRRWHQHNETNSDENSDSRSSNIQIDSWRMTFLIPPPPLSSRRPLFRLNSPGPACAYLVRAPDRRA